MSKRTFHWAGRLLTCVLVFSLMADPVTAGAWLSSAPVHDRGALKGSPASGVFEEAALETPVEWFALLVGRRHDTAIRADARRLKNESPQLQQLTDYLRQFGIGGVGVDTIEDYHRTHLSSLDHSPEEWSAYVGFMTRQSQFALDEAGRLLAGRYLRQLTDRFAGIVVQDLNGSTVTAAESATTEPSRFVPPEMAAALHSDLERMLGDPELHVKLAPSRRNFMWLRIFAGYYGRYQRFTPRQAQVIGTIKNRYERPKYDVTRDRNAIARLKAMNFEWVRQEATPKEASMIASFERHTSERERLLSIDQTRLLNNLLDLVENRHELSQQLGMFESMRPEELADWATGLADIYLDTVAQDDGDELLQKHYSRLEAVIEQLPRAVARNFADALEQGLRDPAKSRLSMQSPIEALAYREVFIVRAFSIALIQDRDALIRILSAALRHDGIRLSKESSVREALSVLEAYPNHPDVQSLYRALQDPAVARFYQPWWSRDRMGTELAGRINHTDEEKQHRMEKQQSLAEQADAAQRDARVRMVDEIRALWHSGVYPYGKTMDRRNAESKIRDRAMKLFGSWKDALAAAGIPEVHRPGDFGRSRRDPWSLVSISDCILNTLDTKDLDLSYVRVHYPELLYSVLSLFDSWDQAVFRIRGVHVPMPTLDPVNLSEVRRTHHEDLVTRAAALKFDDLKIDLQKAKTAIQKKDFLGALAGLRTVHDEFHKRVFDYRNLSRSIESKKLQTKLSQPGVVEDLRASLDEAIASAVHLATLSFLTAYARQEGSDTLGWISKGRAFYNYSLNQAVHRMREQYPEIRPPFHSVVVAQMPSVAHEILSAKGGVTERQRKIAQPPEFQRRRRDPMQVTLDKISKSISFAGNRLLDNSLDAAIIAFADAQQELDENIPGDLREHDRNIIRLQTMITDGLEEAIHSASVQYLRSLDLRDRRLISKGYTKPAQQAMNGLLKEFRELVPYQDRISAQLPELARLTIELPGKAPVRVLVDEIELDIQLAQEALSKKEYRTALDFFAEARARYDRAPKKLDAPTAERITESRRAISLGMDSVVRLAAFDFIKNMESEKAIIEGLGEGDPDLVKDAIRLMVKEMPALRYYKFELQTLLQRIAAVADVPTKKNVRRGHSQAIFMLPHWMRPILVVALGDWSEGIGHLLAAYGLRRGLREVGRQWRNLLLADVDLGRPRSRDSLAVPLVGWVAGILTGASLLITGVMVNPTSLSSEVLALLGSLTLSRSTIDALLVFFVPDHELAPVKAALTRQIVAAA